MLSCTLMVTLLKLRELQKPKVIECSEPPACLSENLVPPVVRLFGMTHEDRHLDIIMSVFEKIGYNIEKNNSSQWDVLWSHVYPFHVLNRQMARLRPYQKVNHFPGSGYITQKANLAMSASKHVPKAFVMPQNKESFLEYSQKNPKTLWVQKSNSHRGIKVNSDIRNFSLDAKGTFIQEFIKNPFLIDERKFDIGVYVTLTSIDPLRVYIYTGDVLLRFCTHKYYLFNPENLESYVVNDDYLPVWKVSPLQQCFSKFNFTAKECLNNYLRMQGKNPEKIWLQIHEAIRDVYIRAEDAMIKAALKFGNLRTYFELVRFDFVLDENLNVFLLEANMSPNLSSEHFPPNRLLYEQVVFNVFSLTGLTNFLRKINVREEFEVSTKDIQVFPEDCTSNACQSSCKYQKCHVCGHCMTEELRQIAKTAYIEHLNKRNFHRLIPVSVADLKDIMLPQEMSHQKVSAMNYFMDRWFKGKCLQGVEWCQ